MKTNSEIIELFRKAGACKEEVAKGVEADKRGDQKAFDGILLANYVWCVEKIGFTLADVKELIKRGVDMNA